MDWSMYSRAFRWPLDNHGMEANLQLEMDHAIEQMLLALLKVWMLQKIRRQREESSEDNDEEEEEDESEEDDEETEEKSGEGDTADQAAAPIPPTRISPLDGISSRKRPWSFTGATTLPGSDQAQDPPRKRARLPTPPQFNMPKSKAQNSMAEHLVKVVNGLQQGATQEEIELLRIITNKFKQTLLEVAKKRYGKLFPGGFPPRYHEAMADAKKLLGGALTPAQTEVLSRNFQQHPRLPEAYFHISDQRMKRFFLNGWLQRPLDITTSQRPHESVLQVKHMKEIDGRPRGSSRDRVKLWLMNVTVPEFK